jgi:Ni,Fe-hydrogenase maturation factor
MTKSLSKNKQQVDINIHINVDDSRHTTLKGTGQPKVKIVSKLSVPQLAYFFHVLYQMKKIKTAHQTDIMKFIAENFETANAHEISINSLRSKYYKVDEKVKAGVRKQLTEIIQFMDNEYK